MIAVVLAGGSGQRLWPVSREGCPKQFLSLTGGKSLLQETVSRIPDDMETVVVTTGDLYHRVRDLLGDVEILTEPCPRNTAAAVALACVHSDDLMLVLPSDHVLSEDFFELVREVEPLAEEYIVTFGITPAGPATGYGYVKPGRSVGVGKGFRAERFVEKPPRDEAERLIADGFLWNSGIFLFKPSLMREEFEAHLPEVYRYMGSPETMTENYERLPRVSIDKGIIEKSSRVAVVPFRGEWHDVGSWREVYTLLQKEADGNVVLGDAAAIDTTDSLIFARRPVAVIGLDGVAVVDAGDAVLVADLSRTEDVREAAETFRLKEPTVYRPWGYYTVLESGERYKVKRLCIHPKKSISHQMHHHRAEHWVVVKGTARVEMDGEVRFVHENESIYVPKSTPHRLENPGKMDLHVIEIQTGEYLEEDDIVRFGR